MGKPPARVAKSFIWCGIQVTVSPGVFHFFGSFSTN
jgi:hypothetical protein